MAITLTDEEILKQALNANMVKGAQLSKRYTDQEVGKSKTELREEFENLTGQSKDAIDAVVKILDQADLNEDGQLDITKFHQDLVARVAINEAKVKTNGDDVIVVKQGLTDLSAKIAKEINDRILQGQTFSTAINAVKADIVSIKEDLATVKSDIVSVKATAETDRANSNYTRALALSNQKAMQVMSEGLATTAQNMADVFGFADASATNAY